MHKYLKRNAPSLAVAYEDSEDKDSIRILMDITYPEDLTEGFLGSLQRIHLSYNSPEELEKDKKFYIDHYDRVRVYIGLKFKDGSKLWQHCPDN